MEIKVSNVKDSSPQPKKQIKFWWACTKCKHDVCSEVVESVFEQYKLRNLGKMAVERQCSNCGTYHKMELS